MSGSNPGKVFLVGAGPGDPGLITQRGSELLRRAQVVVVDALVSRELLKQTRGKIISVGKRGPGAPDGSSHELAQEKINQLLVRLGKSGKQVVRLKGGDPFLFGRGCEELEALRQASIPCEVVPGLSSATAVPAWVGIPVTDRRYSSQVTILTGHEGKKKSALSPGVDWGSLSPKGTLVILMGVSEWPGIMRKLQDRRWPIHMPVAAIEWGTTPRQRVLETTLEKSVPYFQKEKLTAPAIIVVGDVVRLRKKRIVVTRPADQSARMIELLEQAGMEAVSCPAIQIHPLPMPQLKNHRYDWLIFLSVNAVKTFSAGLKRKMKVPVLVVGPETKRAAQDLGWLVKKMPKKFNSTGVVSALGNVKGRRILIPRVQSAPKDLVSALRRRGALVDEVATYRVSPVMARPEVKREILNSVAGVAFTSASTVNGFFKNFSNIEGRKIFKNAAAFSIGPQTTAALKKKGIRNIVESANSATEDLVGCMQTYFGLHL